MLVAAVAVVAVVGVIVVAVVAVGDATTTFGTSPHQRNNIPMQRRCHGPVPVSFTITIIITLPQSHSQLQSQYQNMGRVYEV